MLSREQSAAQCGYGDCIQLAKERDAAIRERDEARAREKAAWHARDDAVSEAAQIKDACDTAVSMARADEARALARVKVLEQALRDVCGSYYAEICGEDDMACSVCIVDECPQVPADDDVCPDRIAAWALASAGKEPA